MAAIVHPPSSAINSTPDNEHTSTTNFIASDDELKDWQTRVLTSVDSSSDWQLVFENATEEFYKKKESDSEIYMIHARVFLPSTTPQSVFDALFNPNRRREWDNSFLSLKIQENFSENDDLLYSQISAPFPLTNRDSLQHRSYRIDNTVNQFTYIYRSVDHEKVPENKNFVRTQTVGCFYGMKGNSLKQQTTTNDNNTNESTNGTVLYILMRSDPRGAIPTMIINTVAPRLARKWVERLRNYCSK